MKHRPSYLFIAACCLCLTACGDDKSTHSNQGGGNPGGGGGGEIVDPGNQGEQGGEHGSTGEETECEPGETQCDGYALLTCNKFGQFESEPCGSKQLCFDLDDGAQCMTQSEYDDFMAEKECTPGDTMCALDVANTVLTCTNDGTWGNPRNCAETGQICEVGDNGIIGCLNPPPPRVCDDGESRCNADTIQICDANGQWEDSTNCALNDPPQSCELSENTATCVTGCTEGLKRCTYDGQVETCTEGVYVAAPCPDENTICGVVEEETRCVPKPECTTGETQCDADDLKTCIDGFWQTGPCPGELKCRVDETSQIAACTVIPCAEGATYCGAANTLYTCTSGNWISTNCIRMIPVHICDQNGNTAATGDHDKAACVEPTVSGGGDTVLDTDGDTIPDTVEGRAPTNSRDTDGDTIPDYLDLDSDGDTIPDSVETNNGGNIAIPPDDSDYDGKPNYIDEDSDDNGIPDRLEACPSGKTCQLEDMASGKDASGNELSSKFRAVMVPFNSNPTGGDVPDYLDYDNDGDGYADKDEIRGLIGTPAPDAGKFSGECNGGNMTLKVYGNQGTADHPLDCDGDTIPDYMDTDSDGDGLSDAFENLTMKLGYYARYSQDIDQDTLKDKAECLPYKADGTCRDSDGDGVPDMLETDSDGDSLSDKVETMLGSDPTKTDSDNDDAPDVVEYAICEAKNHNEPPTSCPAMSDPSLTPESQGNFVFITPYKEPSTDTQTLSLQTAIQTVDMFFTFDRTGSMDEEIKSLAQKLPDLIDRLQCKNYGRACEDNNDCADFDNSMCSEQGECILSPSSNIDYNKTCSKDSDCNAYANAICQSGKCVFGGCFANMWTGLGYYSYLDSFWVAAHLSGNKDTTINAMKAAFRAQRDGTNDYSYFCSTGNAESPYQAPVCAALGKKAYKDGKKYCGECKGCASPVTCTTSPVTGTDSTYSTNCGTYAYNKCKINCTTDKTKEGCVGYRPEAIRIFVLSFDEEQCYSNTDWETRCKDIQNNLGDIMKDYKMRFIGLYSGSSSTYQDYNVLTDEKGKSTKKSTNMKIVSNFIGNASGSLNSSGQPFSYPASNDEVGTKTAQAVREITKSMPMDITATVVDIDENALKLIKELKINQTGKEVHGKNCYVVPAANLQVGKTTDESGKFKYDGAKELLPGSTLCYDVVPVQNQDLFPSRETVQVKKARVKVMGDGSVLNSGIAYFVIPPITEGTNM